jgi:hypothetical protein
MGGLFSRKHARLIASSHRQIREDKSVRNVAFSIMLSALALLQIAVVAAELSPSRVEIAATEQSEQVARQVLASTEKDREVSITL